MAHDKFNINAPEFTSLDPESFLVAASEAASRLQSRTMTPIGTYSPVLSCVDGMDQNQPCDLGTTFFDKAIAEKYRHRNSPNWESKPITDYTVVELLPFQR